MRCRRRPHALVLPALAMLALAAGCSAAGGQARASGQGAPASTAPAGRNCGHGRTAAGVKILVMVVRGSVSCPAARQVQQRYASAIASGKVPGNGGGAPVTVLGWVCQGYSTPEVLRTGNTSRCVKHGGEIMAVLPAPSSTASP